MSTFERLARAIQAAQILPFVKDENAMRFAPKKHKKADLIIGNFAIYDLEREGEENFYRSREK